MDSRKEAIEKAKERLDDLTLLMNRQDFGQATVTVVKQNGMFSLLKYSFDGSDRLTEKEKPSK